MTKVLIQLVCFVCLATLTSLQVYQESWAFAVFCAFLTLVNWGWLLLEALLFRLKELTRAGRGDSNV